jgi:hypothetical protein
MAINPNTNFTAGQVLTADQANRWPRGVMNQVTRTTSVSALTTTMADISGMSMTFTADSTRLYKASWVITGQKANFTNDYTEIVFATSGNTQIGGVLQYTVDGQWWNCSGNALFTVASGSVTYKLRGAVGSGTSNVSVSATRPIFFMIEDIGPA